LTTEQAWTLEEESVLAKALAKYPGGQLLAVFSNFCCNSLSLWPLLGSNSRWDTISDLVNAVSSNKRSVKEIIVQAKKQQSGTIGKKTVDSTTAFETYQKEIGKAGSAASEAWSTAQQKQLEDALKSTPKSDQRWEIIASKVAGKNKKVLFRPHFSVVVLV